MSAAKTWKAPYEVIIHFLTDAGEEVMIETTSEDPQGLVQEYANAYGCDAFGWSLHPALGDARQHEAAPVQRGKSGRKLMAPRRGVR